MFGKRKMPVLQLSVSERSRVSAGDPDTVTRVVGDPHTLAVQALAIPPRDQWKTFCADVRNESPTVGVRCLSQNKKRPRKVLNWQEKSDKRKKYNDRLLARACPEMAGVARLEPISQERKLWWELPEGSAKSTHVPNREVDRKTRQAVQDLQQGQTAKNWKAFNLGGALNRAERNQRVNDAVTQMQLNSMIKKDTQQNVEQDDFDWEWEDLKDVEKTISNEKVVKKQYKSGWNYMKRDSWGQSWHWYPVEQNDWAWTSREEPSSSSSSQTWRLR